MILDRILWFLPELQEDCLYEEHYEDASEIPGGEFTACAFLPHMAGWWEEWFQMDTKHRQSQERVAEEQTSAYAEKSSPIRPVVHLGTMVDAFTWLDSGFVFYKM